MKKIALIWILLFVFQIFGQNKPIALKFDEFSFSRNQSPYYRDSYKYDYPYDFVQDRSVNDKLSFQDRVIRFAQELLKRKNTKAYILFYNQRIGNYPLDKGKIESQEAIRILTNQPRYSWYPNSDYPISPERVNSTDGGFREEPTLEFWIVPQNAEPPMPTPSFKLSETAICPEINVVGDYYNRERNQPLNFSVSIKDEAPDSKLSLEWNVSAGKIIKGQNTKEIEVALSGMPDKFISASVTLKGLHPECKNHDFASTRIVSDAIKVDEFSMIANGDLKARLDNLMNMLNAEPPSTGYIIIYTPRNGDKRNAARISRVINQSIQFRGFDKSRMTIVEGGFREEFMVEFYLTPAGAELPKATPTLDNSFVNQPKKIIKKPKKNSK
jgi:hypothetical protein